MADALVAQKIDAEIARREKIVSEMQNTVRKRVVELKIFPGETLARIKQIDGVLIEFDKKE